jgi:hypothetical protein
MFWDSVTPPYIFTPLNHHPITLPYIYTLKTPTNPENPLRKTSLKTSQNPINSPTRQILDSNMLPKNIAPKKPPKTCKPSKKASVNFLGSGSLGIP